MNVAFQRNIGSFIRAAAGLGASSITAGGAGDNTAITGLTLDRNQFNELLLSGVLIVQITPTLADGESVAASCVFEDSADGTTWAVYEGGPPDDVDAQTISESGAQCVQFKCQLGGARRYVRGNPTFNMSATGTDTTAVVGGIWVVGGSDELPITNAPAAVGVSS